MIASGVLIVSLWLLQWLHLSAAPSTPVEGITRISQNGFRGNNADAIAYLASTFHVPLFAEVIYHNEEQTVIPIGSMSMEEMLSRITRQAGEQWERQGNSIHIFNPSVVASKRNAFGVPLSTYKVGLLPSRFVFYTRVRVDSIGERSEDPTLPNGIAVSGVLPVDLDSDGTRCLAMTFENKSARDIILAETVPARLASIVIFPENFDSEKWHWASVEINWFWLSVDKPFQSLAIQERALVP